MRQPLVEIPLETSQQLSTPEAVESQIAVESAVEGYTKVVFTVRVQFENQVSNDAEEPFPDDSFGICFKTLGRALGHQMLGVYQTAARTRPAIGMGLQTVDFKRRGLPYPLRVNRTSTWVMTGTG